ncbi:hypothetical protein [Streptomyces sudanensis]|uniref:hypothetical protein n=1 Tax=Streptomyces sudanensis TaxID=436397 RepID=UPI0027E3D0B8|nr:hypothetical protein [Streptomyces sudanensis]
MYGTVSSLVPLAAGEGVGGRAAVLLVYVHEDAGASAECGLTEAETSGESCQAGVAGAGGKVEEGFVDGSVIAAPADHAVEFGEDVTEDRELKREKPPLTPGG